MKTHVALALSLLVAGCVQPGQAPSAPIAPVGQIDPNANATSLAERGLGPTSVAGPTVPRRDRPFPSETVEVVVKPGDAKAKKSLAWFMADEETTFFNRSVREDGTAVYHFLRKAGVKTAGDTLDGVRIYKNTQ